MTDPNEPGLKDPSRAPFRWVPFLSRHFIVLVTLLPLLIYMFTYFEGCFGSPIRADGAGYYIYLPSYVLHGDPSFKRVADQQYGGQIPGWTGVGLYAATDRYLNRYSAGVAIMMLPFFLVAHVLTWLFQSPPGGFDWWRFNHAMDGYTLFYQHAAGLAGLFYMVAGLGILKKSLERMFTPGVVLATLSALLMGTNLLHYGSGESVLSHPYSFFLFAVLLCATDSWHEDPGSWRRAAALGLVAGMIALVRLPNAIVFMLIPMYGLARWPDVPRKARLLGSHIGQLALMVGVAVLLFGLQVALNRYATGRWVLDPYRLQNQAYGFAFFSPQIMAVLFSLKRGVFFWSPVLLACLPGLYVMWKMRSPLCSGVSILLALHLWIVSSWFMWWYGGGFGHRGFVEFYAVMAIPWATFAASLKTKGSRALLAIFTLCAVIWSLVLLKLYYTREISFDGLNRQALFDIVWLRKNLVLRLLR